MSRATLATRWRAEPGQARALGLALAMHGVLAILLVVGVSWQSRPPAPVFAELWTPPTPAAAPVPPTPPTPPQAAAPPSAPPQRVEPPTPPAPKVDLNLEQQRKAEEARRRAAEQAAEARARERRLEEQRKAEAAAKEKAARDKEQREKEQRDKEAKARETKEREARAKADEALREKLRERVLEQASKDASGARPPAPTGAAASATAAAQAQAAAFGEAGYVGRLRAAIRANTVFAPAVEPAGNPEAVFVVTLAPDCAVLGVSLKRGSGLKAWDDAAERALRRTDPFPRPPNVACPSSLEIAHRLRD